MPSMDGGGVEKNLIIIANYISKKGINVNLISFDDKFKENFNKKINFIKPRFSTLNRSKYYKYFFCLLLLARELIKNNCIVFSFQANIYAIILWKILNTQIIIRSNHHTGWNKNFFKILFLDYFLKGNEIIVNSFDFKRELDSKFDTNLWLFKSINKQEILKNKKLNLIF